MHRISLVYLSALTEILTSAVLRNPGHTDVFVFTSFQRNPFSPKIRSTTLWCFFYPILPFCGIALNKEILSYGRISCPPPPGWQCPVFFCASLLLTRKSSHRAVLTGSALVLLVDAKELDYLWVPPYYRGHNQRVNGCQ